MADQAAVRDGINALSKAVAAAEVGTKDPKTPPAGDAHYLDSFPQSRLVCQQNPAVLLDAKPNSFPLVAAPKI